MNFETASTVTNKFQSRKTVVPVVVQQIMSSTQQEFKMFGKPAYVVVLTGIIRKIEVENMIISFRMEDFSGSIKCVIWLSPDDEAVEKLAGIQENRYVKAFGQLQMHGGCKTLAIAKMFPVNDANVIVTHLLSTILARLEAESEFKQQISSANSVGAALANALTNVDESAVISEKSFTPLQESVINIIQAERLEDYGINRRSILRQFPAYQGKEVEQAIDYLIAEGFIYPTIDQNHFKSVT